MKSLSPGAAVRFAQMLRAWPEVSGWDRRSGEAEPTRCILGGCFDGRTEWSMWTLTIINHGKEKRDTCKGSGIDGRSVTWTLSERGVLGVAESVEVGRGSSDKAGEGGLRV